MTKIKIKKRCNLVDGGAPCKNCTPAALVEKLRARVAELEAIVADWEQKSRNWMATPAAATRLDGYRELAARVAELETAIEKIREELIIEGPGHLITAIEYCDDALAGREEPA